MAHRPLIFLFPPCWSKLSEYNYCMVGCVTVGQRLVRTKSAALHYQNQSAIKKDTEAELNLVE